MINKKIFAVFAILIASISGTPTFAQIIEPIVVTTDKESYDNGDVVKITGEVKEKLSGFPVSLQVIAANGNLVTVKQVDVNADNKFSAELTAGGGLWKSSGIYTVKVLYGTESRTNETTFEFGSSESMIASTQNGPTIPIENTNIIIGYEITNGEVTKITPIEDANSLVATIKTDGSGELSITLPRTTIDAKIGDADDDFFVLVDGNEVNFEETTTTADRTLKIPFPDGAEEIEIIGTFVVPEFGSIAIFILAIAVTSIVVMTTRSRFNMFARY